MKLHVPKNCQIQIFQKYLSTNIVCRYNENTLFVGKLKIWHNLALVYFEVNSMSKLTFNYKSHQINFSSLNGMCLKNVISWKYVLSINFAL